MKMIAEIALRNSRDFFFAMAMKLRNSQPVLDILGLRTFTCLELAVCWNCHRRRLSSMFLAIKLTVCKITVEKD